MAKRPQLTVFGSCPEESVRHIIKQAHQVVANAEHIMIHNDTCPQLNGNKRNERNIMSHNV